METGGVTDRRHRGVAAGLVGLGLVLLASAAAAVEFRGRVVGVTDGDTLTVLRNGRAERIRLRGIDAPEQGQAFGQRAKQFASALAFDKTVTVLVRERDRRGRTIADVMLPDGRQLGRELVRAGYAWWYRRYSTDPDLAALESAARASRAGLWSDAHPVAPWEWRRSRRPGTGPSGG
jgi:micrococcal nuclease